MHDGTPAGLAAWCEELALEAVRGGASGAAEVAAWTGVTARAHGIPGAAPVTSIGERTDAAVRRWRSGRVAWAGGTVAGAGCAAALLDAARVRLADGGAADTVGPPHPADAGLPEVAADAARAGTPRGGGEACAREGAAVVTELSERLAAAGVPVQAVLWEARTGVRAVCNSRGVRRAGPVRREHVLVRSESCRGALVEGATATGLAALQSLVDRMRAAHEAAGSAAPPRRVPLPAGLPVLLRPAVSAAALAPVAALLRGDGPLARPGAARRLGGADLHLDVPAGTSGGEAFDDEGVTRTGVALVRAGRVVGFLDSARTAADGGRRPNGCAFREDGAGQPSPRARALRLAPAGEPEPPERVELVTAFASLAPTDATGTLTVEVAGLLVREGAGVAGLGRLTARIRPGLLLRSILAVADDATMRRCEDPVAAPSLLVEQGVDLEPSRADRGGGGIRTHEGV